MRLRMERRAAFFASSCRVHLWSVLRRLWCLPVGLLLAVSSGSVLAATLRSAHDAAPRLETVTVARGAPSAGERLSVQLPNMGGMASSSHSFSTCSVDAFNNRMASHNHACMTPDIVHVDAVTP